MNKRLQILLAMVVVLGGVWAVSRMGPKKNEDVETQPSRPPLVADARAQAILRAADDACRKLTAATFEADYKGEGVFSVTAPSIRGTVSFDAAQEWVRVSGSFKTQDGPEQRIEQASDAERVVTIDHTKKLYVYGEYPFGRRLLNPGIKLLMVELGNEAPFADELEGGSRYEGIQEVSGATCDVVYVEYDEASAARWFIAQEDHLPRRVERIYNNYPGMEDRDKTILTIAELNVEVSLAKADFQIPCPEGYEEFELPTPQPLLAAGTEAPPWELKTAGGTLVRLADLRGNVVVLDFWATWCGPCKMAMPKVQELHAEFQDRPVKVFGVNCLEDEGGDPGGYMKSKSYTYGLLMKGDDVAQAYHVPGLPTFYVIDGEGRVVYTAVGAGQEEELKKAVIDALDKLET